MRDPRHIIDDQPMSAFQWRVVAIMVGLNAIDGFDVLSISFASPGIAKAWSLNPASLGVVLSMELVGMAFGSLVLGSLADRLGRRRTILGCLVVMAAGMFLAARAQDMAWLSVCRVLTGLGIGGMLAATNAAVAEVSNARRRDLCVVLMAGGFPTGAVIGGAISTWLLGHYSWHAIFDFGAVITLCFVPLVFWFAPESIAFETHRRRPDALASINRTLQRMGHDTIDALPDPEPARKSLPIAQLFSPALIRTTLFLTAAYLTHIMTFYFIFKWIPKIVVDLGFAPVAAAGVLVWANIGGAAGSLILGLLSAKVRLRTLTAAMMLLSVGLVAFFGSAHGSLTVLTAVAVATGFVTTAGVVGLYGLLARSFPTEVRATATGFAIGIGRGGSALAPALAGILFGAGFGLQTVAIVMACGSAVAVVALLALRDRAASAAG